MRGFKYSVLLVSALSVVMAQDAEPEWEYHLPETGLLPSAFFVRYVSNMGERHGGSSMGWQQYELTVPFADPRRTGCGDWYVNAALDVKLTHVQASGALEVPQEMLHMMRLPVSLIHPMRGGRRLIMALAPTVTGDGTWDPHCFDVGGYVNYAVELSDTLSYSVGAAFSPRLMQYGIIPAFSVHWKLAEDWEVNWVGYDLRVMRQMGVEGLSAGVFASGMGGYWSVHTEGGERLMRIRTLAMGVALKYDFSRPGQTKRILMAELGSTVATTLDYCRFTRDNERVEGHHFHPGFYVAAGVDFRF